MIAERTRNSRQSMSASSSEKSSSRSSKRRVLPQSVRLRRPESAGIPEVPVEGTPILAPVPFHRRRTSTQLVAGNGVSCRLRWGTANERFRRRRCVERRVAQAVHARSLNRTVAVAG